MFRRSFLRLCKRNLRLDLYPHVKSMSFCNIQDLEKNGTEKANDPKWMKFFKRMELMSIDVERATKSANVDILHNYVKSNYFGFNFNELTVALGTLFDTNPTNRKLVKEIKLRICTEKHESNKKNTYNLCSRAKEIVLADELTKKYILLEIDKHFEMYNHSEQTDLINFMFKAKMVKTQRILQYLSFYNDTLNIEEYFSKLKPHALLCELEVFQSLYQYLTLETFEKLVDWKLLDALAYQVLQVLAEPKIMSDFNLSLEFESLLPSGIPSFFTPSQQAKYKIYLASNFLYTRYNVEDNLGVNIMKGRYKNIVKHLTESFGPGDRHLLEKPIFLLFHHLRSKLAQNRFLDLYLFPLLTKFEVLDLSFLQSFLDTAISSIKQPTNPLKSERELLDFAISRWREATNLNFDEALKSLDGDEKPLSVNFKSEMTSVFEKFLMETDTVEKIVEELASILTSLKPQNIQVAEIKTTVGEEQQKDETQARSETIETSKLAAKDTTIEDDGPTLLGEGIEGKTSNSRRSDETRYEIVKEMELHVIKTLNEQLNEKQFVRLSFYEKTVPVEDMEALRGYLGIVESSSRLLLFKAGTSKLLLGIKKFFKHKEHELIFEHLVNFPGFIDNLVLIDLLARDQVGKLVNNREKIFSDSLRMRIYQEKNKLDNFYRSWNGKIENLLMEVEAKLLEKISTTNEMNVSTAAEAENLLSKRTKIEYFYNHNREKYNKEIEFLRTQEREIQYKFSNYADISELFASTEEGFYVRCINSPVFVRMVKSVHLKRVIARILNKMNIPYHQDYCDFPFVADFLLFPKESNKLIIQVVDSDKMILGVENVPTLYNRACDTGLTKLGYKTINFRLQDYDIEEAVLIERIRAAIDIRIKEMAR